MQIFARIKELNAAQATLAATTKSDHFPWVYTGDVDIREGGTAIRVNRMFNFADVVEATDLGSAIGQADCSMIERGSVTLDGNLRSRRRYRAALSSFGWNASDLLQFPRELRMAELARAVWVYGARDTDVPTVIRHAPADEDCSPNPHGPAMEEDEEVDGESGLIDRYMEALD